MNCLITIILASLLSFANAGDSYPLREPMDGEGRPLWWWALWRDPVVVVRGSVKDTEKPRPDLSIMAPWDSWRKLTAPSLAGKPTVQGVHFLITTLNISEVVYIDPALSRSHADFARLAAGKLQKINCILPAEVHDRFPGSDTEEGFKKYSDKKVDKEGLKGKFVYRCRELHERADKEQLLVFQYSRLYPVDALVLYDVTSIDELVEARRVAEYRTNANKRMHSTPDPPRVEPPPEPTTREAESDARPRVRGE